MRKSQDRVAKRDLAHHSSHGRNAHYCVRQQTDEPPYGDVTRTTYVGFRHGRVEDGGAVQMTMTVIRTFDSGVMRETFAEVTLDAETWAGIVEHVKAGRDTPIPNSAERVAGKWGAK